MKNINITNKNDYIKILDFLEKKTKYIELLQLIDDEESNLIIDKYSNLLISKKNVSNWIDSGAKGVVYKFDINLSDKKKIFGDLKSINSFFYNKFDSKIGEIVETTEFGYMNIAFFDLKGNLLFYTITHEGIAWINY
ncbi:hypothetical protein DOK78_000199 [Enterococcus sp. DIV2402]|uniref:Uncharacterized protein n=1 Tax=Candidatus Enterococcus lowellii TaxID=2230877 RepID=A0ABZ2SIB6_9ENTE|nr:hypothetical protein [Enterococcus sp. DIV2402]MBO0463224.1 hypothetical protein [Enterococcus sp. DIV2402]